MPPQPRRQNLREISATAAVRRAKVPALTGPDRIDAEALAAVGPAVKLIRGGIDEFV